MLAPERCKYGIEDGKLFAATCNLEGPFARKPTCVVSIGAK